MGPSLAVPSENGHTNFELCGCTVQGLSWEFYRHSSMPCVCVWRGGEEGGGGRREGGRREGGEEGGGGGGRGLPHYLTEEFKQHKTHFSEIRWWVYGGPNTGEDREYSESTPGTVNSV